VSITYGCANLGGQLCIIRLSINQDLAKEKVIQIPLRLSNHIPMNGRLKQYHSPLVLTIVFVHLL